MRQVLKGPTGQGKVDGVPGCGPPGRGRRLTCLPMCAGRGPAPAERTPRHSAGLGRADSLGLREPSGPSRASGGGQLTGQSLLHRGAPGQAPEEWTGGGLFYLLQPKRVPGLPASRLKAL